MEEIYIAIDDTATHLASQWIFVKFYHLMNLKR